VPQVVRAGSGPFDALSDRAKHVLALAQDEAQRLSHGHIGTEHLLPALVRDSDSPPGKALAEAGVTLAWSRAAAERAVPGGGTPPSQQTLTPRMKRILELATRLAGEGRPAGRGHMLMALIDDEGGVEVGMLRELGVDLARLRARTLELMQQ